MSFWSKLSYVLPVLTIIALLYLWNSVSPSEASPGEILLVFILLYAFFLSIFFLFAKAGFNAYLRLNKTTKRGDQGEKLAKFKARKVYYVASVIAFFPVLLLAMQSIGQLKANDVVLVGVLLALAIFYVVKRS